MTTAPTSTAPEKKRSVLTRTQARFVEDVLEDLTKMEVYKTMTRREALAMVNTRCEPKGWQITMANLVAAAETVGVTLPGSRDADAERDRELLEAMATTLDTMLRGAEDDGRGLQREHVGQAAQAWLKFRAGPLFAGKGETQG